MGAGARQYNAWCCPLAVWPFLWVLVLCGAQHSYAKATPVCLHCAGRCRQLCTVPIERETVACRMKHTRGKYAWKKYDIVGGFVVHLLGAGLT
jgi:hypothetical protein